MYDNFVDLLIDINTKTSLNSRQLDILIKLDYFSLFGEANELTYITSIFSNLWVKGKGFKKQMKKSTAIKNNLPLDQLNKYCEEYKLSKTNPDDGNYSGLNAEALVRNLIYEGAPLSLKDKIKAQQEYLSYIDYINPDLDARYVVVTNLDTSYSPKFIAYCLKNGKTSPMKVRKTRSGKAAIVYTTFKELPFEDGDILYMKKCKQEPKTKMVDGEWIKDYANKEWWLYDYDIRH